MGKAYGSNPDTFRYPWEVSVKNRYSKRLVAVEYWETEKEAKASAKEWRGPSDVKSDYIVKVRNAHPPWRH